MTLDTKHRIELVGSCERALASRLEDAAALTPYAVEYRYPGDYPQLTASEAAHAVALADGIRNKIRAYLRDQMEM